MKYSRKINHKEQEPKDKFIMEKEMLFIFFLKKIVTCHITLTLKGLDQNNSARVA